MESSFDLDPYLERIGRIPSKEPSLATLAAIHLAHAQTIPFENLNPLLGLPVKLDIDSLQEKMIRGGRGGYCYEHNKLFGQALKALGFDVKWLAARVVWNLPEGVTRPRTHMVLLTHVEGEPYLADVGFGGATLTAPLRLVPGIEQQTPHEPFRLMQQDGGYRLEMRPLDEWVPLYVFDLQEQTMPDYEVGNWFVATHPNSFFRTGVMAGRVDGDTRYGLINSELSTRKMGREAEKRTLTTVAEMCAVLQNTFGIDLSNQPDLDAALEKILAAAP